MATYTKARATTQTLSTTIVDTVSFSQRWDGIEIENLTGTSAIAATTDGTVPAVDGDDSYHIEPGDSLKIPISYWSVNTTVVKLVGNGNKYRVTAIARWGDEL